MVEVLLRSVGTLLTGEEPASFPSHEDNLGSLWESPFSFPTVKFYLFTFKANVFTVYSVCVLHPFFDPMTPRGGGAGASTGSHFTAEETEAQRTQSEPRSARPHRTCHKSSHPAWSVPRGHRGLRL